MKDLLTGDFEQHFRVISGLGDQREEERRRGGEDSEEERRRGGGEEERRRVKAREVGGDGVEWMLG